MVTGPFFFGTPKGYVFFPQNEAVISWMIFLVTEDRIERILSHKLKLKLVYLTHIYIYPYIYPYIYIHIYISTYGIFMILIGKR